MDIKIFGRQANQNLKVQKICNKLEINKPKIACFNIRN